MHPIVFGLAYLGSWLLIGLGIFMVFALLGELRRRDGRRVAVEGAVKVPRGMSGTGLAALTVLTSICVTGAGAYVFLSLMVLP